MRKFKNFSLKEYCEVLSQRTPVPGGGSAAALAGALGASLLAMVANYSFNRGESKTDTQKIKEMLSQIQKIRNRFLDCVDLDAQAYLKVVNARKASAKIKKKALNQAAAVPREVCRLCHSALTLMPFLVQKGNPHLLSDIEVAMELFQASYQSARINVLINE